MSVSEQNSLLGECIAWAALDLQTSDGVAGFLGSLVPVSLAVTLLSTPRLRKQWAFRILMVALIVLIVRCTLKLQVSTDWSACIQ